MGKTTNVTCLEKASGTWDDEHVKALLHFPRFPTRLIQQEPWQSWIVQRGGLKAVYAYLQGYPLTPSQRRILDVVLSNPESVANVYADRLNISRATYFYQLRELVPTLVQALNLWEQDRPASPGPTASIAIAPPPSLPVPLTNLIGVEALLQSLARLFLREDVRLLTLLGVGGIGKTRLAIELIHRLSEEFGEQFCFIDLSIFRDPDRVPALIAQTMGLKETGDTALKNYLRPRKFLLALDNFEHLASAHPLVTDLLAAAPRLKILITSRAALHVYGEHEYVIQPMALPPIEDGKDPGQLVQNPAVSLFVQRAQEVNPSFTLGLENCEAVLELCRLMEGIPLAIELAALQVKYFSPQALLVRASNIRRLAFLGQESRKLPCHQQSLRGMLDWSYALLSPHQQILFCRLGVFTGGCTIEAAQAVCCSQTPDQGQESFDVQTGLTSLVDQSLLMQQQGMNGDPRFDMLGIAREYALEQLDTRQESESLREAHAVYFLQLAEGQKASGKIRPPSDGLAGLQKEYANIRAAITWALEHRQGEMVLRFVAALWDYWKFCGELHEGRQIARAALELTSGAGLPLRGHVLRLVGWLAHDLRDYTTMVWAFQSSLDLSESLSDREGLGLSLQGLGELARLHGQPEQAKEFISKSLEIFREPKNILQSAWSLDLLGRIELGQGEIILAEGHFQDSLDLFEKVGPTSGSALALVHLGQALFYQGQIDESGPVFEKSLGLGRQAESPRSSICALSLNYLGEIAMLHDEFRQARELVDQSLRLSRSSGLSGCIELGCYSAGYLALENGELESAAFHFREGLLQQSLKEDWCVLQILEAVAALMVVRNELLGASRLYAASEGLRESLRIPQWPVYEARYETSLAALKKQLDGPTWTEVSQAGRALPLDQAILYALRCLE